MVPLGWMKIGFVGGVGAVGGGELWLGSKLGSKLGTELGFVVELGLELGTDLGPGAELGALGDVVDGGKLGARLGSDLGAVLGSRWRRWSMSRIASLSSVPGAKNGDAGWGCLRISRRSVRIICSFSVLEICGIVQLWGKNSTVLETRHFLVSGM